MSRELQTRRVGRKSSLQLGIRCTTGRWDIQANAGVLWSVVRSEVSSGNPRMRLETYVKLRCARNRPLRTVPLNHALSTHRFWLFFPCCICTALEAPSRQPPHMPCLCGRRPRQTHQPGHQRLLVAQTEQDGTVAIAGPNEASVRAAAAMIRAIVSEVEVGEVYRSESLVSRDVRVI